MKCGIAVIVIFAIAACGPTPSNPAPPLPDGSMTVDATDVQTPMDNESPADVPQPTDVQNDRPQQETAGAVCRPSEADPMCTMGTYARCECSHNSPVLMEACAMNPSMCAMISSCAPGRNHCGISLPPDQMYEPFQYTDCARRMDRAVWSINGEEYTTSLTIVNGQITPSLGYSTGARINSGWTCSGDRCWNNWGNMASDRHAWMRFTGPTNPCVEAVIEMFDSGVDGRTGGMYASRVNMAWLRFRR